MNNQLGKPQPHSATRPSERGQSIVILAGGILVLLGFVGLVTDLGYVWARDARLTAAVDAAALAGAPELSIGGLPRANEKAIQFLYTNELPADTAVANFTSSQSQNLLGAWEYTITVTWQLDTFFMRIFGFQTIDLTKRATAAYFPLVDIYASSRTDDGRLSTSTQGIFGAHSCTGHGDPFSALNSPWHGGLYSYRYRVYIPPDYEARTGTSIVRIELFDPDSINSPNNSALINHTQRWINAGTNRPATRTLVCDGGRANQQETCVIPTTELQQTCTEAQQNDPNIFCLEDIDAINPFWFFRVDENRGAGAAPGNNTCGVPDPYSVGHNTQTAFEIYYFQRRPDGTLVRTPLATYTGQTGDASRDFDGAFNHQTDLHWVTPGGRNDFMQVQVPTDCGSQTGGYNPSWNPNRCTVLEAHQGTGRDRVADGNGFEVNLATDVGNIVVDGVTGARYIYLDVTAFSGASENGFELWAGPPQASYGLPTNGNLRNVAVTDQHFLYQQGQAGPPRDSAGVVVYAMGTLPMNASGTGIMDIPLIYVPPAYAGRQIAVSIFDPDSGTEPPLTFYFDTIAEEDYTVVYTATEANPDPEGRCFRTGAGSPCNNRWVGPPGTDSPAYIIAVPTYADHCTNPNDPAQKAICTPFYGGNLYVRYRAARADTYVWRITLPSLPYLVE